MNTEQFTKLKQQFCDADHLGEKVLIVLKEGGSLIVDAATLNFTTNGTIQLLTPDRANLTVVAPGEWIAATRMRETVACETSVTTAA